MTDAIRIGVIGVGHWGPNLIRCFTDALETEVVVAADRDEARLRRIADRYPGLEVVRDPLAVCRDPRLDAVVIATPTETHHGLARAALEAGKHVLVEKPISTSVASATELVEELAEDRERVLMSGHVFLYNRAVQEMKRIVRTSAFGGLRYLYSQRTNLGPVRTDVHAGWDLAAHDISIFLHVKESLPVEVTASAQTFIRSGIPDLVFATLYFEDGSVAHLHTSWLDPQKIRQVVAVGEGQMLVFDDMNLMEPLRIYNKGWKTDEPQPPGGEQVVDTFGEFRVILMQGDVIIPPLSTGQPLREECEAFIRAVRGEEAPLSDGRLGVDVVRVLEAIDRSIAAESRRVTVTVR